MEIVRMSVCFRFGVGVGLGWGLGLVDEETYSLFVWTMVAEQARLYREAVGPVCVVANILWS